MWSFAAVVVVLGVGVVVLSAGQTNMNTSFPLRTLNKVNIGSTLYITRL